MEVVGVGGFGAGDGWQGAWVMMITALERLLKRNSKGVVRKKMECMQGMRLHFTPTMCLKVKRQTSDRKFTQPRSTDEKYNSDILTNVLLYTIPTIPLPSNTHIHNSPPLPTPTLNPKPATTLLIPQHSHQRTNPRPRRPSRQPLPQQLHSSLLPLLVSLQDLLALA